MNMWLNRLFADSHVDFAKRCRLRMKVGAGFVVLGAFAMGMMFVADGRVPVHFMDKGDAEFLSEYYMTVGIALIAAGIAVIIKNMRCLKDPELLKKREIAENDERNRLLGLRCWAYAGYGMFLLLYMGILAGGFISMTVCEVLQVVMAVYALLLLVFRAVLSRCM